MSDHPTPPRLYSEEEVSKILDRATGLHRERPGHSSGSSSGLSLAELEEIALEAGIDPLDLRRAAMELDSGDLVISTWARFAGEQLTLVREAFIPGEIPEAGFERVITVARQAVGELGEHSFLGRTLTWQAEASSKLRSVQLVVAPKDGETHIQLKESLGQTAGLVHSCALGGVGAGVGLGAGLPLAVAFGSVLLGALFPLGVTGLSYIGARRIYRALVGKRRKAIDEIIARVTWEVTSAISSASLQGAEDRKQISGS